jgi:hypothetical protein
MEKASGLVLAKKRFFLKLKKGCMIGPLNKGSKALQYHMQFYEVKC